MVQTNTESIRLWSCRTQWPCSQSAVSKERQSMSDFAILEIYDVGKPLPNNINRIMVKISVNTDDTH